MARKPIPIHTETKELPADANGIVVETTTVRKGLLNLTTARIKHDPTGYGWHRREPRGDDEIAAERLQEIKKHSQGVLKDAGLPHDISLPYGQLTLRGKLEPLSREECAAKLIEAIDAVLSHEAPAFALDALRFASAFHDFIVANGLNEHVMADVDATEKRRLGPRSRIDATTEKRKIVAEICEKFWEKKPNYRGNASKTSSAIFKRVNAALRRAKLPTIKTESTLETHINTNKKTFQELAIS